MRRHILFAAAPACALLLFSPLAARADVVSVPAPPGRASAVAAQVGSLIDISKTSAVADQANPTADASVIRIGGQTLFGLGGSQKGDGQQGGALLDTGASNPIRLEIAPWAAKVEGTAGPTRHSNAKAALARANVANVVKAALLHSESDATWTDTKSTGNAFSNGVELGVADVINVVLLHSEVKTEGNGHSYLVGLNGTEIGTDSELGKSPLCALTLPSVLSLSCLAASGGTGTPAAGAPREAAAEVAKVDPAISAISLIDPVDAFTTANSSGSGSAPVVTLPAAPEAPKTAAAEDKRAELTPAAAPAAELPRTGAALAGLAVSGLVALLGGALLRLTGRRRVTA
jgi:LPXTG cell wall anchor motif